MNASRKFPLLIADVDGTLVDDRKRLSERNREAARRLRGAGIAFTITSARPPRGMAMLFEPLGLVQPVAGFSGGTVSNLDLGILRELRLPESAARTALSILAAHEISPWVFVGDDWRIVDPAGPRIDHEVLAIGYGATVVDAFTDDLDRITKITGVSDDHELLRVAEEEMLAAIGAEAAVVRSQPYYLDVTHKDANKGSVVDYFARLLEIPEADIAVIGDQFNDLAMFRRAGFSIAMGNAPDEVKRAATVTTAGNNEDGFAAAVDRYILGEGV